MHNENVSAIDRLKLDQFAYLPVNVSQRIVKI